MYIARRSRVGRICSWNRSTYLIDQARKLARGIVTTCVSFRLCTSSLAVYTNSRERERRTRERCLTRLDRTRAPARTIHVHERERAAACTRTKQAAASAVHAIKLHAVVGVLQRFRSNTRVSARRESLAIYNMQSLVSNS
jgi:hypothetical protein